MAADLRVLPGRKIGRQPGPPRDEPGTVAAHPAVVRLDHEVIEEIMAGMDRATREGFWRDHIEILRAAFRERGVTDEATDAILADHFRQVRARHRARASAEKREARYPINFSEPPPIGMEIDIGRKRARLIKVEPITRKDGSPTWLLSWEIDGRIATSGLRGKGVSWAAGGER